MFGVDRDHKVYTAWHHDGMDWSCWTDKSREWKSVGGDFPEGALVAATSRFADNIDLFIVGGGVSKQARKFIDRFTTRAPVVAAELRNNAGIVGAAVAASEA